MYELLSNMMIEKVYYATTMYNEAGSTARRSNRDRWAIIIKYEGETVYTNDKGRVVSNINSIVMLPKGSSYDWRCTSSGHFISLEFECQLTGESIFAFPTNSGEEILKLVQRIEYRKLSKKAMYMLENIRDTYSIILKLCAGAEREYVPSEKSSRLLPATEHILNNYSSNITNDFLASLTGLSTAYFRQLFKEVYGVSPIEYVKKLKIKKAKEMLKGDFGSITDVAISLGYSSIYDFSRDFKKHTGVSPSAYVL